jgi:hypothetical protein
VKSITQIIIRTVLADEGGKKVFGRYRCGGNEASNQFG